MSAGAFGLGDIRYRPTLCCDNIPRPLRRLGTLSQHKVALYLIVPSASCTKLYVLKVIGFREKIIH